MVKSITARELLKRYKELEVELWGGAVWTEGFFVATVGEGGNKDIIKQYVAKQGQHEGLKQLKLFDF